MNAHADLAGLSQQDLGLRYIVEQIGSELDLRQILTQILAHACASTGADHGRIGLIDSDLSVLRTEAVFNMPEEPLGREWEPGTGVIGEALNGGKTETVGGEVATPIFWRGELIGGFHLGSSEKDAFSPADIEQLENLGHYAAIAIQNARLLAENERSVAQKGLLLQTSERIGNAMSVDEVIKAYLDQVASNGRYTCNIVVYEFDANGQKIGNVVRGRWAPGEDIKLLDHRVPADRDILDPILASGETVRIADAMSDPNVPESLREEQIRDNRPAVALVPLVADGRRIGLVILSDTRPHKWTDEELGPFQTTAVQLAAVLQSRRDHNALIESDRRLAVLDERRRLARELHDSVTQILFSLNLLAQSLEPGEIPPTEIVDRIVELSRRGLGEMRSLLEELRPVKPQPDGPTLPQRIAAHAATLIGLPSFRFDEVSYRQLPEEIEQQLFRICQEALNNIAKHAKASNAWVTLQSDGSKIKLTIVDDGIGMTMNSKREKRSGFGLTGMKERADEIKADLRVESTPGGTTVEVGWPANAN